MPILSLILAVCLSIIVIVGIFYSMSVTHRLKKIDPSSDDQKDYDIAVDHADTMVKLCWIGTAIASIVVVILAILMFIPVPGSRILAWKLL